MSSESQGPAKPTWTGKPIQAASIEGYFLPWQNGQPLFVKLNGCDDWFLPIFSTEEKLDEVVSYLTVKGYFELAPYSIKQVTGQRDFLESIFEGGVRVMADPQIINENHTKWTEVVFSGDEINLMADQCNIVPKGD